MQTDIKFYTIMKYPAPLHTEYYRHISETNHNQAKKIESDHPIRKFSRSKKDTIMDEYTESISRRSWIFRHIPFIRQVYLCNSITFNALHKNSDIDICIISKWWYLRLARIFSRIAIHILNLHRQVGKYSSNTKKVCLSFYIDEDHTNLLSLRKKVGDIYLSYWIAHCVLLYSDNNLPDNHMFITNKELLSYLPNHPLHQTISLELDTTRWRWIIRNIIEYILTSFIGKTIQYLLSKLRSLILHYKTNQLSTYTKKDIVISGSMLKFHQDKRTIIQHKRKTNTIK